MDKRTHKRCIKCRKWKRKDAELDSEGNVIGKAEFGVHADNADGKQVICYSCKSAANNRRRNQNVTTRLRHHIATRCLTQLGSNAPLGFTKDLEGYLGYRISSLVKHLREDLKAREGDHRSLRDAFDDGYHVDHIRPLMLFHVVHGDADNTLVNWDVFRECWAPTNLSAIPGGDNLAKGAKWEERSSG